MIKKLCTSYVHRTKVNQSSEIMKLCNLIETSKQLKFFLFTYIFPQYSQISRTVNRNVFFYGCVPNLFSMTAIEWKNKNTYYLLYVALGNFRMICKHSSSEYSIKCICEKKEIQKSKQFAKVTETLMQKPTLIQTSYI